MTAKQAKFVVEKLEEQALVVLRVRVPKLLIEDLDPFRQASRGLLKSSMPRLVVDLSRVEQIFSVYVGSLVDLAGQAQKDGKALVVLVRPRVAKMFRKMQMEKLVTLQIVDDPPRRG